MHLTTKLFFAATLLAGNLFASFAGDVTLKITKKYINLPVSHQMDRKKMTFEVKGAPERNFVIRRETRLLGILRCFFLERQDTPNQL